MEDYEKILPDDKFEYDNHVIKPPSIERKDQNKRFNTLIIDSRDRNYNLYPNSNDYTVDLDEVYQDVLTIELVSAKVPFSNYLINKTNNVLYFSESTIDIVIVNNDVSKEIQPNLLSIEVPPGNYLKITLAAKIQDLLNAATTHGYTYTVTYTQVTDNYTISSTGYFQLIFNGGTEPYGPQSMEKVTRRDTYGSIVYDNNGRPIVDTVKVGQSRDIYVKQSIARVIGFSRFNRTGDLTYSSDYRCDFSPNNYISLKIVNLSHIDSNQKSIKDSFAIIPTVYSDMEYCQLEVLNVYNSNYTDKKAFTQPKRIGELKLRFYTYDGELYDFQGMEHRLVFNITSLKQNSKYLYAIN